MDSMGWVTPSSNDGINISVYYNHTHVFIYGVASASSLSSGSDNDTIFKFPSTVYPFSGHYTDAIVLSNSWYPDSMNCLILFTANSTKIAVRVNNSSSSNRVIIINKMFPRGFFSCS